MKKANPVLQLRDEVLHSDTLQQKILAAGAKLDFQSFSSECGHACSVADINEALKQVWSQSTSAPVRQGDGTLPLRAVAAACTLLRAALDAVADSGDGTLPLMNGNGHLPLRAGDGTWPLAVITEGWIVGGG